LPRTARTLQGGVGFRQRESRDRAGTRDADASGEAFELVALDLASLKSVRARADGLLAKVDSNCWY
jgi:hypothetical protein